MKFLTNLINLDNLQYIGSILFSLSILTTIIVYFTPTKKDDTFLCKLLNNVIKILSIFSFCNYKDKTFIQKIETLKDNFLNEDGTINVENCKEVYNETKKLLEEAKKNKNINWIEKVLNNKKLNNKIKVFKILNITIKLINKNIKNKQIKVCLKLINFYIKFEILKNKRYFLYLKYILLILVNLKNKKKGINIFQNILKKISPKIEFKPINKLYSHIDNKYIPLKFGWSLKIKF